MGNAQVVKQHIQTSEKTGVFTLKGQKLKEVPEPLRRLAPNLRTIDLSDNSIIALPSWIGDFSILKNFILNHNQLQLVPSHIGGLTKLETFSIANNQVERLPVEFGNLTALRQLNLQSNIFSEFPSVICQLPNLDVVDLSKNRISKVPEDISGLKAYELNLNQNQISTISEEIHRCPRLKVLRLDENCIPLNAITPRILRDSQISLLTVEGNVFQMKELQYTDGYEQYMERYTANKKKL